MAATPQRLPPEVVRTLRGGVSVIVSSCDSHLRPSIMRAVGIAVADDGSAVTVYLNRAQSRRLLQDIGAGGQVAVVITQPTTHWALQLKSSHATLRDANADDESLIRHYGEEMEAEIERLGFRRELTRAMLAWRIEDVVAVTLPPEQAFTQTPGPRAGSRLELGS
jgi:hypothetical protein